MGASLVYILLYIIICLVYHSLVFFVPSYIRFLLYHLGDLYVLCVVYILFFIFIIIMYVAQYTLYYLTQPLLIFRFLNPQNSMLYDSHNYEWRIVWYKLSSLLIYIYVIITIYMYKSKYSYIIVNIFIVFYKVDSLQ